MSEAMIVILSGGFFTVLTAVLPLVIQWISGRRKVQVDEAVQIRKDQQTEAAALRAEMRELYQTQERELERVRKSAEEDKRQQSEVNHGLQTEMTAWRERYFDLYRKYNNIVYKYNLLISIMQAQGLGHLIKQYSLAHAEDIDAPDLDELKGK